MGEKPKISWLHYVDPNTGKLVRGYTINPWIGCSHARFPPGHPKAGHVHPGCARCYAQALNAFHVGWNGGRWGPGAPRHVMAESGWKKPLAWARAAAKAGERRRVFFSLGDPLDEESPPEAQARLWQVVRDTARVGPMVGWPHRRLPFRDGPGGERPGLDWLFLTKRPWRWRLIPEDVRPLVWLGTSASDQETADAWVPELLRAKGFRKRFLSIEPMVGPIDLDRACNIPGGEPCGLKCAFERGALSWVIVGGESGPKARPFDLGWARSVRDQCRAAGVAYYFKQAGSRPYSIADRISHRGNTARLGDGFWRFLNHPSGADMSEWPEDLRIQEMPT